MGNGHMDLQICCGRVNMPITRYRYFLEACYGLQKTTEAVGPGPGERAICIVVCEHDEQKLSINVAQHIKNSINNYKYGSRLKVFPQKTSTSNVHMAEKEHF